ncbi:MAG: hypothetical protein MUF25_03105 [Pirellulaceae bacterium]|nr:hypothetical protein [Pirellulaceae bacterium]
MRWKNILTSGLLLWGATSPGSALDHVTLEQDGKPQRIVGKILTEAQDGGLLVQDRQGVLWAVQPKQLVSRTRDDTPFEFLSAAELQAQVLAQLPEGFRVHTTARYLIGYNTLQLLGAAGPEAEATGVAAGRLGV